MNPIWIVDDDPSIRFVLERALAREGLPTRSFSHPHEVLEALESPDDAGALKPSVLVSDIRMPGLSGLQVLEKVHASYPGLPVIIMTAYSDLDSAVSAFQRGAFEYLAKPFDLPQAVALIRRAAMESDNGPAAEPDGFSHTEMLGQAPAMQDLFRAIGRLSHSTATVLVTGESGSGKELVARALHRHSPAASGPFVAINTAAIPKDLLESELFGHERGAFTGAQALRRGRFEQAEGGTLFLDEIGDMPLDLQTRLLRVLSDGHFYRVGGHQAVRSKVRVLAATHQDLERRVREGHFREDLFHRLNVIRLRLPPLRERKEDIPALAQHFMRQAASQLGVDAKQLSEQTLAQLSLYHFPGNVRELENLCHWLTVMAPGYIVSVQDLPAELRQRTPGLPTGSAAVTDHQALSSPMASQGAVPPVEAPMSALGGAPLEVPYEAPVVARQPVMPGPGELANVPVRSAAAAEAAVPSSQVIPLNWDELLGREVDAWLAKGKPEPWEHFTQIFEARLINCALQATQGRRAEAAQRLGIGRNTLTRKLQELEMDTPSGGAEGEGAPAPEH